ncbi:DUF1508 domain-containing protein [Halonotius terrestris]|uniref:DUF1508 domain-containing protein n=1 Tax=Halonotius terrestris TaxID=2487750 RepID=A0A8J8TDI1_9EURY|nr:amphi-Trp domain-containing protein [Halonotius terrestris]TQQ83101.1 DUF1508 domain-containing protein [Halonotius terrestris]
MTDSSESPTEYEDELTGSREEIATVLSGVVDGLLTGGLRFGEDADVVSVGVADEVTLEIELEAEHDDLNLELELDWTAPDDESAVSFTESEPDETDAEPALAAAADATQSVARFEVFRDRAAEWRWRLRHRNGNIIAVSGEGYTQKHNAQKGLRSVMANSSAAELREEATD